MAATSPGPSYMSPYANVRRRFAELPGSRDDAGLLIAECPACGAGEASLDSGDGLACTGGCSHDVIHRAIVAPPTIVGRRESPDMAAALHELSELLALGTVGRRVVAARLIGRGSAASVDLILDDDTTVTFERFGDMTRPALLATEIATTTGAVPALKQPQAMRVVVLVRQVAQQHEAMSIDEAAIEWGVAYLQDADVIETDLRDQGERWRAFCELRDRQLTHDPLRPVAVVLLEPDGTRTVRSRWFADSVRLADRTVTYPQIATRMQRVGWRRSGRAGRMKATSPRTGSTLIYNVLTVPAGWGTE
jgi:hypothetical protein